MKLGIIARSDNTGLGNQTMELVKMLNPDKILLINSHFFNNNEEHPDWYRGYDVLQTAKGMPHTREVLAFLDGLDVVISCETFYHLELVDLAKERGIKTILQYNYELFGHLAHPEWTLPDVLIAPSIWNLDAIVEQFGKKSKVIYLPPPTDHSLFNEVKDINLSKDHKKILHIGGKKAAKDRNGTDSIFEMIKYSKEDYEIVIKSQTKFDSLCKDPRVKIEIGNPDNRQDMYKGFDAMVLPRRYAGLCLPMNEALMSGMPVFMTNISPNNAILPPEWLAESTKIDRFRTKSLVDVYSVNPKRLAQIIDNYVSNSNKDQIKNQAYNIGLQNFSVENLKQKYLDIINE
jgi:glycosyltransferase involved in cell wall biosynthesis